MVDKQNLILASIFLMTACVVVLFCSFLLPWFGIHTYYENVDSDGNVDDYEEYGFGLTLGDGNGFMGFHSTMENCSRVFLVTTFLLISAVASSLIFLIVVFLYLSRKTNKVYLPIIFASLIIVLSLIAPLFFMFAFPYSLESDIKSQYEDTGEEYEPPEGDHYTKSFFGSHVETDDEWYGGETTREERWGGDIGWMLPFVSVLLTVLSLVLFLLGRRKDAHPARSDNGSALETQRTPMRSDDPVSANSRNRTVRPRVEEYRPPPGRRNPYRQDLEEF